MPLGWKYCGTSGRRCGNSSIVTLVYQPQLNQQRKTVGAEALLRWSVDGRAVPPDDLVFRRVPDQRVAPGLGRDGQRQKRQANGGGSKSVFHRTSTGYDNYARRIPPDHGTFDFPAFFCVRNRADRCRRNRTDLSCVYKT